MAQWALTKVQPELARSHAEVSRWCPYIHVQECAAFNLSWKGVPLKPLRTKTKVPPELARCHADTPHGPGPWPRIQSVRT